MGYAAHASAAGRPKPHERVKRLRYREAWVFRPLFTGNQPGAAVIWPYAAVECAWVSSDGEGAAEVPNAASVGCISNDACQPIDSSSD